MIADQLSLQFFIQTFYNFQYEAKLEYKDLNGTIETEFKEILYGNVVKSEPNMTYFSLNVIYNPAKETAVRKVISFQIHKFSIFVHVFFSVFFF